MASNPAGLNILDWKKAETQAVQEFLDYFRTRSDVSFVVYSEWTAKDVLGHIASWHMSFARNLLAAVRGEEPTPLRGTLTSINEGEVKKLAAYTTAELIAMIEAAQETIHEHILNPNVAEIVYRAGARRYSPMEHLELVSRHIRRHLMDLRKRA